MRPLAEGQPLRLRGLGRPGRTARHHQQQQQQQQQQTTAAAAATAKSSNGTDGLDLGGSLASSGGFAVAGSLRAASSIKIPQALTI